MKLVETHLTVMPWGHFTLENPFCEIKIRVMNFVVSREIDTIQDHIAIRAWQYNQEGTMWGMQ